jgi:mannose-6-phosphate isomerase
MDEFYPLQFEPIFKNYLWGGRRLARWFPSAPAEGPIAEVWLVSDEAANPSVVANGPLKGATLRDLVIRLGDRLLGRSGNGRFPLLLKFLDATSPLSVQVHPTDEQAARLGSDARGKTEAWVVLHAEAGSRIYAGLKPGVDATKIRQSLRDKTMADCLHAFEPKRDDCVFLTAGTVHAIGAGPMIFEVQQTCDITYRLYDWDRVDPRTGQSRPLHIEESLACANFELGPCHPVSPISESATCERLVECRHFRLHRHRSDAPFTVGAKGECRIVVGVGGQAALVSGGREYRLATGDVWMLAAEVGACRVMPAEPVTVLECGLPKGKKGQ